MDYPHTAWVFYWGSNIRLEEGLQVLVGRGLAVNFRHSRVEAEWPEGSGAVVVNLRHGPRVRQIAASLVEEADSSWGWQLAKCDSAFVITCYDHAYNTPRLGVLEVWEKVVSIIQATVGGIQYSYSDPDSEHRFVLPADQER